MPYATNATDGIRIHYEVEGDGPPLVLMHGLMGSLHNWRANGYVNALKGDYLLILIDARGHGESDKPHDHSAYKLKLRAGDVVAVLDDLKVEKAHYFGYSMGGRIGFALARYALDRFHSLILGGHSPYQGEAEQQARDEVTQAVNLLKEDPDASFARRETTLGRPLTPEEKARALAIDFDAIDATRQAAVLELEDFGEDLLPTISIPCLLFAGDADSRYDGAKDAATHIPNATFVSLPGLNHVSGSARIDLVLPHVTKFLAEVSQQVGRV